MFYLVSQTSWSQNWTLFPLNQKSYFYDSTNNNHKGLELYLADSVRTVGSLETFYFKRKIPVQGTSCNATNLFSTSGISLTSPQLDHLYSIDSILQTNDTTFFYSTYSTQPFYFLPKCGVGQSWTISSSYSGNDYNDIAIECIAMELDTFCGIIDSVKIFNLTPSGSSVGQIPISDFQLKISKQYGIVEMVPFQLFLYHPPTVNFNAIHLQRIEKDTLITGIKLREFHDYFPLQTGDVVYRHLAGYPLVVGPSWIPYEYFDKDSITSVVHFNDTVYYSYEKTRYDSGTISHFTVINEPFTRSQFSFLETLPGWIGVYNDYHPIFNYFPYFEIDITSGDTTFFSKFFTKSGIHIISTPCNLSNISHIEYDMEYNSIFGETHYCGTSAWYMDCREVTGGIIGGQIYGDISFPNNINNLNVDRSVYVYPNPFSDVLQIKVTGKFSVRLLNCLGEVLYTGSQINTINTNAFEKGIYYLALTTESTTKLLKLVKQ